MLIFLSIMFGGLVLTVGGAIFGHDHDLGHDHDASGHDHDENQGAVSIFSVKVLGTFIMGFGGGGTLAEYNHWGWTSSSLAGVVTGLLLGLCMYLALRAMYGHQANSIVYTNELLGKSGVVTTSIDDGSVGEVNVSFDDRTFTYLARSTKGISIPKGSAIKVVSSEGSQLLVEQSN